MPFEYLDHTADLGIRGTGQTPEETLSEGARAMLAAICDLETVTGTMEIDQMCTGPDIAATFCAWLNELLYQSEVKGLVWAEAKVLRLDKTADGWILHGRACGEPMNPDAHDLYSEIKAATYAGLIFRQNGEQYMVQCVLDI